MLSFREFELLYEEWVEHPSAEYRRRVGSPVNIDAASLDQFLQRLHTHRADYPNMAFWLLIDYKTLLVARGEGDEQALGAPVRIYRDMLMRIHPDYLLPYFRWRKAAYQMVFLYPEKMRQPLLHAFRISLPLRVRFDKYWWFCINSTVVQMDAEGRIATILLTFYRESEWSPHNLRPVEASLFSYSEENEDINKELAAQLSLQMSEVFTDAELDLLALYAAGRNTDEVLAAKNWSRHTLHEYNAHLLRKSKELFVYDFKSARDFAEYCQERQMLLFKPISPR